MDVSQELPHIGVADVDGQDRMDEYMSKEGNRLLTVCQGTASKP
jgi:hypothetical protein